MQGFGKIMSNIYHISDLHLGHKNILKFAKEFRGFATTVEEHDEILTDRIASKCNKRDRLFIHGDVAMDLNKLNLLNKCKAAKIMIRGNHDNFPLEEYLKVFDNVEGFARRKQAWLSHAPIHPQELRNKINIHGHVHQQSILTGLLKLDQRYVNVCVENCGGVPVNYQDIVSGKFTDSMRRIDYKGYKYTYRVI